MKQLTFLMILGIAVGATGATVGVFAGVVAAPALRTSFRPSRIRFGLSMLLFFISVATGTPVIALMAPSVSPAFTTWMFGSLDEAGCATRTAGPDLSGSWFDQTFTFCPTRILPAWSIVRSLASQNSFSVMPCWFAMRPATSPLFTT